MYFLPQIHTDVHRFLCESVVKEEHYVQKRLGNVVRRSPVFGGDEFRER